MKFNIDLKVTGKKYGSNTYYAGVHWTKRKKVADEVHQIVKISLMQCKIKRKVFKKPVEIRLKFNSRLDIDNHGFLTKMIIDGMKDHLIEDDSRKFVKKVTQEFYDGEGVAIEVVEI